MERQLGFVICEHIEENLKVRTLLLTRGASQGQSYHKEWKNSKREVYRFFCGGCFVLYISSLIMGKYLKW